MRKAIRKIKEKKPKFDPQKYRAEQHGALVLEQYGRYFGIRSTLTEREHADHLNQIKTYLPTFRLEINRKIEELIKVAEEYSPLELLAALAPENIFGNPETIKESTFEGKEAYVEYGLSIALSIANPNLENHATKEAIGKFQDLIAEIFNDTFWYFATDNLDDEEGRREIRTKSISHFLMVRGDSYPEHHIELVRDIFTPHDAFFRRNYGFTTGDVLGWINALEKQGMDSFRRVANLASQMRELHKAFVEFSRQKKGDDLVSVPELVAEFDQIPWVKAAREKLTEAYLAMDENMFEIRPSSDLPKEFLDLISAQFGENGDFATFEKSPGWITNDSIISRKPLIVHSRRYYCFGIQLLYRNIIHILESLIREIDNIYFQTTYQKGRGNLLSGKAIEYLENILSGAQSYSNLFYRLGKERFETDGIIIFDSSIFIVEAKGGALTLPAKRGSVNRIRRNVTDLIDDAYTQALRTKRFITDSAKPRFEYEDGSEALVLTDKKLYRNIYLINVTLDNLSHLATHLPHLKELDLLKGKEWIWSVFINDLRIISEIIESPSEFLVYLQRRLEANNHPELDVADELDFFLYYLKEGLYFGSDWLKGPDKVGLTGFTDELDRYYNYKASRVTSGKKPRLEIPEDYKRLIKRIEATKKPYFSEITTRLLGFSVDSMEEILKQIEIAKDLSIADKRDHDFTMIFGDSDLGLTVSVRSKDSGRSREHDIGYCDLKMYQLKIPQWLFLAIDVGAKPEKYDFEFVHRLWKYNPTMEKEVAIYRSTRLRQYLLANKQPGPNEACPCHSGLKFKKCCQVLVR